MIKTILEGLKFATNETEEIRIAKGKYKIATNLKEAIKQIKDGRRKSNQDQRGSETSRAIL